ncbi:MAG: heavy metal translocating P-type ATPase [Fimbriimonadaceae bacterium]|nr:heavy metal translocating P-type ATPase [Fimbriimonadaceae bacterium]
MKIFRDIQVILTVLCGIFLVLSFFGLHVSIAYLSVVFGSYFALKSAYEAIRERSLDVNFLMVFAAAGAVALGHPTEAAVLLFLFSLSSTLEAFAMSRTKSAIEGLIKLRPDTALRITASGDEKTPVEEIEVGDMIRVVAFELVPLDGVVESGESSINQSAMTGESVPVSASRGTRVLAGTQNLDGMLTIKVAAKAGQTTLEKIVDLVQDAQENKASGERISTWFGQRYTIFVIVAFAISLVVRLLLGQDANAALYAALTLLVALSPCALVISTPASTLSALAWAARNGMLIRGGEFIEQAGKADILAVDKTGTLTAGRFELAEICVCQGVPEVVGGSGRLCMEGHACWSGQGTMSDEAKRLLRVAAAAEQYSTHPIAEAIVESARQQGLDIPEATEHHAHTGLGVTANVEGKAVKVGQRKFFDTADSSLDPDFAVHAEELQHKGFTVVVLDYDGMMAAIGLHDAPRPSAKTVLRDVQELGIRQTVMMTGDTRETAEAVASEVGITDVRAGLFPEDKEKIVAELTAKGGGLIFVGDGVNDAPSLARASVGVAMGGLGSDIALNAADVVLMNDRLESIPRLIKLGRMTNSIIRANLYFAGSVIVVLTLGSMFFDQFLPDYRNLILPLAVVGHEGSTVLVILNGLRLLRGPANP